MKTPLPRFNSIFTMQFKILHCKIVTSESLISAFGDSWSILPVTMENSDAVLYTCVVHLPGLEFFARKEIVVTSGNITVCSVYPTALKGCQGIVFTHGVRMGRRREKVCPGCISETVRCRKLTLGRDIG